LSDFNGNGGVNMKWAHLILLLGGQLVFAGAAYGILKFEVEDHARRLNEIERKQDANFIPRSEYDRRHDDLIRQMQELREEVRELERHR